MNLFLKRQLIKFQLLSFCKILKKFLAPIQSYEMCHFRTQNCPFFLNNIFWVQIIIITFICLLALFVVQNLQKFLQRIQSFEDAPFLDPKWSICPKQIFFQKIINVILIYLLAPFIVQNFNKILPADPQLRGCVIFGGPSGQMRIFSENLLTSLEPYSVSEILTIKE